MIHLSSEELGIKDSDIAIIGMSGRFPEANTIAEFWQNLRDGRESISRFSEAELLQAGIPPEVLAASNYVRAGTVLDNVDRLDASFFGFNPKEAAILDPQHRIFLECVWEVLEQAGYAGENDDSLIGLYAGAGTSQYLLKHLYGNPALGESVSDYQLMLAAEKDFLPTRVAYKLNLNGPAVNVQTACSTSLVAIHLACQALLNGDCDLALAGGVSLKLPQTAGYLYQAGMVLSPDGRCRAFDGSARGTLGGSGAGVVLLKLAADAIGDRDKIYALIKGTAVNNDGNLKAGFTAPSAKGQAAAIAEAQAIAEVSADTISYIEAHGTGTELGDPIEIEALTRAFRQTTTKTEYCAIGSLKTNVGHLDTAAGVAGIIKTALALQHRQIPPSLHLQTPNPKIDWANSPFFVNSALRDWPRGDSPRRAGVSSFGIGGTNAHGILEEAPTLPARSQLPARPQLLVLAAKTESALGQMALNLAAHLQQHPELPLADVAYTLSVGRRAFPYRRVLVAATSSEAVAALQATPGLTGRAKANPTVVFLFPGQGSQYVNMGRDLYEGEPAFATAIDRCAAILEPELGLDLRSLLYPEPEFVERATQQLMETAIAQPAIFTVEYALMELWQSWGISPQSAIGHSIGEYVAACRAGVFTLEDALHLLAVRGRLIQELPPGGMLSVPLSAEELQPLLGADCAIAAINEKTRCVASGPLEAMADLETKLATRGIEFRRLHTSHAFHSPMMEPILAAYTRAVVTGVALNPPQMPFISSVTGTWITEEQATDPNYWSQHLRRTVQFAAGLEEILGDGEQILLEVGPGRTLSTFAKRHPQGHDEQIVLTSMRHPQENHSDRAVALQALGQLWLRGASVDWSGVYAQQTCDRLPLPTYPFERQRFWIDPPGKGTERRGDTGTRGRGDAGMEALPSATRSSKLADWFYLPAWKRVSLPVLPALYGSTAVNPYSGPWLVFLDPVPPFLRGVRGDRPPSVGAALVARLRAEGETVCVVEAGSGFEKVAPTSYRLNPSRAEDYQLLLQDIAATGDLPTRIVHLWTVTETPPRGEETLDGRLRALETMEDLSFYSLVFLAQALGKHYLRSQSCQLTVISNGMQDVMGAELRAPAKALLLGPVQTIPAEYPQIACRSIDLDFPGVSISSGEGGAVALPQGLVANLLTELRTPISEVAIAYRGNYRWVRTFEPVSLPDVSGERYSHYSRDIGAPVLERRLRPEGVYLITGGLGGIGLEIATYLAQTVSAKLALIGRSPFPPRTAWLQWLAENPEDDPTALKIRKLQHLENLGAEVLVCSADVSDAVAMAGAIAKTRSQFGEINGVIHGAGVASGGLIQLKTRAIATENMACKVQGTVILDALLQDCELDFLVLFSSLNSVQPVIGQVDYCGSNAFLDAFARFKAAEASPFTVAINWDGWQEVGMAADAARDPRYAQNYRRYHNFLSPAEGVEAMMRILQQPFPQVLVSTEALAGSLLGTRELEIESDVSIESAKIESAKKDVSPQPTPLSTTRHPRPQLPVAYVAPRNGSEKTAIAIWEDILGIEPIGINDNFLDLGGDSLIATQVVTRLRKAIEPNLSVASLFETPTIAMLVASLPERCEGETPAPDTLSTEREEIEL